MNPPDDHCQPPPPENGFGHHFQPLPQVNSFGAYPQMTPAANTFEPCPSHSRRHNVNYYEPRSDIREQLLPKPDVKKFDGDPLDYLAFRNRFKAHIADWLPKDKKLSYLLQHCNQKVAEQIRHYADYQGTQCSYEMAWEELRRRYGQPHVIAQACEERLRAFPNMLDKDPEILNKLAVLLRRCCSSLESTPGSSSLDTVYFITTLISKLPVSMREEWVKTSVEVSDNTGKVAGFHHFTKFIEEQARVANSVYGLKLYSRLTKTNARAYKGKAQVYATTAPGNHGSEKTEADICMYSKGRHKIYQCGKFSSRSYEDKWKFVVDNRLCKLCLRPGHISLRCYSQLECKKVRCRNKAAHHTLLHPPENVHQWRDHSEDAGESFPEESQTRGGPSGDSQKEERIEANVHSTRSYEKRGAYLDIVPIKVVSNDDAVETYALLDSGSDRTFCEKQLMEELGLTGCGVPQKISIQTMNGNSETLASMTLPLNVSALDDDNVMTLTEVIVVDKIPVEPNHVPNERDLCAHAHLRDVYLPQIANGSVMLLIGNDNPVAHRCLESRFSPDPEDIPDAIRTPLGWVLRGIRFKNSPPQKKAVNFFVKGLTWPAGTDSLQDLIITDEGEFFSQQGNSDLYDKEEFIKMLSSHKEMLEFGLKFSREDPIAYDAMCRNVKREDDHYQLPLLWRDDSCVLPDSKDVALKRLKGLKKRLQRDELLHKAYTEQMDATLNKGYAEKVPDEEINCNRRHWYIPHHPVVTPKKTRIVYDCAAISQNQSLNNHLMKGPDLTNSLIGVLLRFRKGQIAIASDIEAMFYQIKMAPKDRDCLRFLWWPGGELSLDPEVYRMKVHLFGAKSSPSCATFCLRETAREFGKFFDPIIAETVLKNFYVDDCLVLIVMSKVSNWLETFDNCYK